MTLRKHIRIKVFMPRQLQLFKGPRSKTKLWWVQKQHAYGGSLNYRKVARPFDSKMLTHAVFKAKLGRAIWFTRWSKGIQDLLRQSAAQYGVKLRDVAVNQDHIHVVFYTKKRENQIQFLRFFSAEMGRRYKKIRRKFGVSGGALWVARPFTRLVSWGKKSIAQLTQYLQKNRDEAMGFVAYTPRKHALSRFLKIWERQWSSA